MNSILTQKQDNLTLKLIVDLEYIDISPDFTLIKHDIYNI